MTGDRDGDLVLFALDLEGRLRWQSKNGAAWTGDYPGARATCAFHEGRLFHLNAHGRAAAFDAQTGRELWAVDILDRFRARNLVWAMSECLLVDQDRVLVTPGGDKAFMAALDAKTGQTVWSGDPLPEAEKQRAGYASPILLRSGGRRMIVTLALRAMVGVDADTGKVLWSYPKRTAFDASAATPAWTGSGFFYTLPLRSGAVLVRLDGSLRPDRAWEHALDNCQGGVVAKDGMIYGSGNQVRQWFCLDAATGQEMARWNGIAPGSLIWAGDRLYCLSETGEVVLAKPHPEALSVQGRFRLVEGRRTDVWTHPVLLDGRLYLRDHGTLFCYDVRAPK
jgi:outer membrane protein assembly factor BamB